MNKLYLAPQAVKGLTSLASLNQEEFLVIAEYLKKIPVGIGPLREADNFFNKELNVKNFDLILPSILGVVDLINSQNKNRDEILNDLIDSLESSIETKDEESQVDLNKLKGYLKHILDNSKNLRLTLKARDLISENENNFDSCRIITDIRLLFDDNITNSERNAVIIHKLHLTVRNSREEKDIFLHLDLNDLRKLKEMAERAMLKEELIKEDYENIHFINLENA